MKMLGLRRTAFILLVLMSTILRPQVSHAGLSCVRDNLRALLRRQPAGENGVAPATPETVNANRALYQRLQTPMRTSVERAAASGRLKVIRVTRTEGLEITGYEILPAEIVPGRYYSAIRLPDGSIAIGEFDYRNGIHTAMAKAFGGRPREQTFPQGLACGGIIFYDTGAQVGGFCRNYPEARNLREIARELRRMGINVDNQRSTPGRIVESNPRPRREDVDDAPMRF